MFEKRRVLGNLGLALMICGTAACGLAPQAVETLPSSEGFDTTNIQPLAAACSVDPNGNVTLSVAAGETAYLYKRAADNTVVANALTVSSTECTFAPTKKVTINATAINQSNHKVLIDFYGGTFGLATAANAPNIVIDMKGGNVGTNNQVKIRGTANADTFTFGTLSSVHYLSMAFGASATALGAARTYPDMSMSGITDVIPCGGPGNDVITGQGGTPIGGTSMAPGPLAGTVAMTAYGGAGDDTIVSGAAGTAVNRLYGNAGNDVFPQQVAKAHDVISGGTDPNNVDVDTLDYSSRTGALTITLGDDSSGTYAAGSITMTGVPSDNDTVIINDGTTSKTFEFQLTGGFVTADPNNTVIDLQDPNITTAAKAATAIAAGITGLNVTAVQPDAAAGLINVSLTTVGPKASFPSAAITAGIGSSATIVDFTGGSAVVPANDGETSEADAIGGDIEIVIGSSGNDIIDASATGAGVTRHTIYGMAGNDTLSGGSLADTLWGGTGDDTLMGMGGADTLNGGDGNDIMQGGTGNDNIDGGGFNCAASAFAACTTMVAAKSTTSGVNPGYNTLDFSDRSVAVKADLSDPNSSQLGASGEKDVLVANSILWLRGGSGDDILTGDANPNIIWGGGGADAITGNAGNDALYGEGGNDTIHGNANDDFLSGGAGTDKLYGDDGNDFIENTLGTAGEIYCGNGDADIVLLNGSETVNMDCEN